MPSIVSSGIGSGLDIAAIVQGLVAAEGGPAAARINRTESRLQAQLSGFGSLKSALSDFKEKLENMKDLNKFLTRNATSADDEVFTATAAEKALPSSYSIEVVQLAQAQKLTSAVFTDGDAVVGTGTLTITMAGTAFNIVLTSPNNTLFDVRDAINSAVGNVGIAASIVNVDGGSHLILTGVNSGLANSAVITQTGGDGGLSVLEYDPDNGLNSLTQTTAAQDSLIRVDGLDVTSATNSITGVIAGVTIDLVKAAAAAPEILTIENDKAAVRKTVDEFITAYNVLVDTFDLLTEYDPETKLAGALQGDATARGVREQLRRELSKAVGSVNASFSTMQEAGITLDIDGKLSVDDSDLDAVLDSDFDKFGQLFANSDGYAVRLFAIVESYLGSGGIIKTRTDGLDISIKDVVKQREDLEARLVKIEARLSRQFNALDALIGQLTSTSNFLALQLNNLPGFTFR